MGRSKSKSLCRMSDVAKPHKLSRRWDPPLTVCISCKGQQYVGNRRGNYYYCATCDVEFHEGCHLFPPEIRHPFHLHHPLTLTFLDHDLDSSEIPEIWFGLTLDFYKVKSEGDEEEECASASDGNHSRCKSCRENITYNSDIKYVRFSDITYYHCSVCNFSLHSLCVKDSPPLTIKNLKSHDHTLTLFPRKLPLPCDACGFSLDARNDSVYSCLICNYMVHRRCIYLPRVIKITRHQHRLSYTSSLVPSGDELSCGVCRKLVDVNYGQFSCNKGCHYAVHSKCATNNEVWDGKDLEGVPEEEEEDVEPFVRTDEETIQHFSHDHHYLKIHHANDNHGNKFCEACILPITVSDSFYSCVQCDFVLHETCACLPRIKHHPLHKHPLTLYHLQYPHIKELQSKYYDLGFFVCNGCGRKCCGFMYTCCEKDCVFQLDARCASLPDPIIHDCHPHKHPLFFNLTEGKCMVCKMTSGLRKYLECIECRSFLCLTCATIPLVTHYKYDKHPLTLCCGEENTTDLQYWCEICESEIDARKWFYTCNSCSVTLHDTCLLGDEVYMKPNHMIKMYEGAETSIGIVPNSGNSRPVCDGCRRRCVDTLVVKTSGKNYCTIMCFFDIYYPW
ncbi:PREDICTED: uncharacterized protein LOC104758330 isoform X1 [Camelina sativa]|uniref:Uncharacterized protein LOC104758330 isoform X1 n=1 Tax=Camelina sativa TaxID=90675 RepID=A0ABM1R6N6_CAMSA|nr:PREDICTED: uncharacterized protein LOC104758330 isoform X1 [Camelina sativa]